MGKDSLVMSALSKRNISFSYNRNSIEGVTINCVLFKKIAKIIESPHFVMVQFPMDEIEQRRFNNIKEFESYLDNGVV
jgi:hypothetical protein